MVRTLDQIIQLLKKVRKIFSEMVLTIFLIFCGLLLSDVVLNTNFKVMKRASNIFKSVGLVNQYLVILAIVVLLLWFTKGVRK